MAKIQHFFTGNIPPKKYVSGCSYIELLQLQKLVKQQIKKKQPVDTFTRETEIIMQQNKIS